MMDGVIYVQQNWASVVVAAVVLSHQELKTLATVTPFVLK